jgi:rod shape-determining protein MreC
VKKKRRKSILRNLNIWFFSILLLISIFTYSMNENLKIGIAKNISTALLYPFSKAIAFSKNIFSLHQENSQLRRKITLLSMEIQRCSNIKRENMILRELYDFKPLESFTLIPCEIIGKNPGLYNKSYIIDGGTEDGIEKNMAVMAIDGLVGKVVEITKKTSEVVTLYNRNSFVSALNLRSRVPGIVKWRRESLLILDDVPLHSDIKQGDTIVTSGMGGIFPKGIFIGFVRSVRESPKEIVMRIEIEPFVKFLLLEEVFVIVEGKESSLITSSDNIPKEKEIFVNLDLFKKIEGFDGFVDEKNRDPLLDLLSIVQRIL